MCSACCPGALVFWRTDCKWVHFSLLFFQKTTELSQQFSSPTSKTLLRSSKWTTCTSFTFPMQPRFADTCFWEALQAAAAHPTCYPAQHPTPGLHLSLHIHPSGKGTQGDRQGQSPRCPWPAWQRRRCEGPQHSAAPPSPPQGLGNQPPPLTFSRFSSFTHALTPKMRCGRWQQLSLPSYLQFVGRKGRQVLLWRWELAVLRNQGKYVRAKQQHAA